MFPPGLTIWRTHISYTNINLESFSPPPGAVFPMSPISWQQKQVKSSPRSLCYTPWIQAHALTQQMSVCACIFEGSKSGRLRLSEKCRGKPQVSCVQYNNTWWSLKQCTDQCALHRCKDKWELFEFFVFFAQLPVQCLSFVMVHVIIVSPL